MQIDSIAIIQKRDVIYIRSFSNATNGGDLPSSSKPSSSSSIPLSISIADPISIISSEFEEDLFGYDVNDHFNKQHKAHSCSLEQQFKIHSALDMFDSAIDRLSNSSAMIQQANSMNLGFICAIEDSRFYGYITNTDIRIIVSVKDDILPEFKDNAQQTRDEAIQTALAEIHAKYVEHRMNPFSAKQGDIKSKRFEEQMEHVVSSF